MGAEGLNARLRVGIDSGLDTRLGDSAVWELERGVKIRISLRRLAWP